MACLIRGLATVATRFCIPTPYQARSAPRQHPPIRVILGTVGAIDKPAISHAVGVPIPTTPTACVLGFIEGINRGDVEHLASLMADSHRLQVLNEAPLDGKSANVAAWRGYLTSYPRYVIYPHRIVERDGVVVVLGHTTGSHLGLPDKDEAKLTVIWLAQVTNGLLTTWEIKEDTAARRAELGLPATGDHVRVSRCQRTYAVYDNHPTPQSSTWTTRPIASRSSIDQDPARHVRSRRRRTRRRTVRCRTGHGRPRRSEAAGLRRMQHQAGDDRYEWRGIRRPGD